MGRYFLKAYELLSVRALEKTLAVLYLLGMRVFSVVKHRREVHLHGSTAKKGRKESSKVQAK